MYSGYLRVTVTLSTQHILRLKGVCHVSLIREIEINEVKLKTDLKPNLWI